MPFLIKLSKIMDTINKAVGYLCGLFAVLMVLVVFTVVILRYGFGISFIWMQESYVWLHAFIFMLGSGFTYLSNEHVRIDVFYRDASKKYKSIVDILGNIILVFPFLYIIWIYSFTFVTRSIQINEISREVGGLPALYILKSAILFFCIFLFIQSISNIIKSINSILERNDT